MNRLFFSVLVIVSFLPQCADFVSRDPCSVFWAAVRVVGFEMEV